MLWASSTNSKGRRIKVKKRVGKCQVMFGFITVVGMFGAVFCDQSYWQVSLYSAREYLFG